MQHPYHSKRLPQHLDADALAEHDVGDDVIDLTLSNPTRCGFVYPCVTSALGNPMGQAYAPEPMGPQASRAALAVWLTAAGRQTAPGQLMLTSSTSEALSYMFKLALDPHAQVAGAVPGYPLVPHLAELEGLTPSTYRYVRDAGGSWVLDIDSVAQALADGARAVVFVSPHNPTGCCLTQAELTALAELCNRYQALAIFDEVFAPYHHVAPHHRLLPLDGFDRAVSLGGLSKAGLMPQMKLSWIAVHGNAAFRAATLAGLEWIGDAFLSLGPAQYALPALLPTLAGMQKQALARVTNNRRTIAGLLDRYPVATLDAAAAGWYAVLRPLSLAIDVPGEADLSLDLAEELHSVARVHVHPGYLYDVHGGPVLVGCLIGPEAAQTVGWARLLAHLAQK